MGAPGSGMKATDQPAAESLLTAFKNLSAAERRRHASVLNYWLSVRGDKEFPPLHDLDPLELSDAGPNSVLLELISGGHDAEVRHLGEALRDEAWPERIIDAPNPSVLACIAKKLPIVAISRDFLAFEDDYEGPNGKVSCSVTLLPLSAGGAWVDYVYALVSVDGTPAKASKAETGKKAKAAPEPEPEVAEEVSEEAELADESGTVVEAVEPIAEEIEEPVAEVEKPVAEIEEPVAKTGMPVETGREEQPERAADEPVVTAVAKAAPGFSKLLDSIAGLTGFYGSQPVKVEPVAEDEPEAQEPVAQEPVAQEPVAQEPVDEEPVAEERLAEEPVAEEPVDEKPDIQAPTVAAPAEKVVAEELAEEPVAEVPAEEPVAKQPKQPAPVASEGTLQNKLTEVRAKADEARMAKLKAQAALYEGLGAAYDFALDAEEAPEEYLRLVEAQGLKIQLRSPMKPVVKLAFAGMCDDATIKQLEAVLSWAFDEELPRGTLAEKIEAAGGIGPILTGQAKAA
jgi:hypothetical protein